MPIIQAEPLIESPNANSSISRIDASKVPPSRFQKREGSIYATPSSRDGHVGKNTHSAFTEKLREKVGLHIKWAYLGDTDWLLFQGWL